MRSWSIPAALALCVLAQGVSIAAEEVTYSNRIKAVIESRCSGCHGSGCPEYPVFKKEQAKWVAEGKGPRMDTYAHLVYFTAWPDTGALMRRLDDGKGSKEGKPGNMYAHLGETEAERQNNLAAFRAWVGDWNLKRWKEITKEELDRIRVTY